MGPRRQPAQHSAESPSAPARNLFNQQQEGECIPGELAVLISIECLRPCHISPALLQSLKAKFHACGQADQLLPVGWRSGLSRPGHSQTMALLLMRPS
jgi:hypothetical protein